MQAIELLTKNGDGSNTASPRTCGDLQHATASLLSPFSLLVIGRAEKQDAVSVVDDWAISDVQAKNWETSIRSKIKAGRFRRLR